MLEITEASYTRRMSADELSSLGISQLLFGADIEEERAATIVAELEASTATSTHRLEMLDDALCNLHGLERTVNLFESGELADVVSGFEGRTAIDLTSLEHRVWAPFVRALVQSGSDFVALYAEPDDYRKSEDLPGNIYDLSTSRGIEPLPGFARIAERGKDEGHFAPLLGFEGARLSHIVDQEEVEISNTSPIVGSPGFRIEYPTYTYLANRDVLELDRMDQRVEYARASCPFEAFRAIERIQERFPGKHLRVAPIGTKPHALGAILYAVEHPSTVEVIYDHPVRSTGRTRGSRGVYVYEVSSFMRSIA